MTQYYECHITMEGNRYVCELHTTRLGWKFSAIDGDPTLGKGVKCYATTHINVNVELPLVVGMMNATAQALSDQQIEVVRQKVELVLYDTKQKASQNAQPDSKKPAGQ